MAHIKLILEKGDDGTLWGRATYKGNLVVDTARSFPDLKKQLRRLFQNPDLDFEPVYDLTAFFMQMDYVSIAAIAKRTKISSGLMRQYAAGLKYPSPERAKEIEKVVNELGRELSKIKITAKAA